MVYKLSLFTIVFLILITFSYADESSDTSSVKCSDSDNGINYQIKGTISLGNTIYTDRCITQEVLEEFYCAGSKVISQKYKCVYSCNNGACSSLLAKKTTIQKSIPQQQKTQVQPQKQNTIITCIDSDNGIDTYKNGIVTISKNNNIISTSSDFCASNNILIEKYCKFLTSNNEWKIEQFNYNCECTNGRCLQKTQAQNIQNIEKNIQKSPKKSSFLDNIFLFLGLKSPTTQAIRDAPKQEFSISWIFLLLFIIAALFYLRSIYNEPKKKSNQKAFKSKK